MKSQGINEINGKVLKEIIHSSPAIQEISKVEILNQKNLPLPPNPGLSVMLIYKIRPYVNKVRFGGR